MGVEARGFLPSHIPVAVRGVSGVLGSLRDNEHLSQLHRSYAPAIFITVNGTSGLNFLISTAEAMPCFSNSTKKVVHDEHETFEINFNAVKE